MNARQVIEIMNDSAPGYKPENDERLFPLDFSIEPTPDPLLETPYNIEEYPQPLSGYLHIVNKMRLAPGHMNKSSHPMSIFFDKAKLLSEPGCNMYHMSAIIPICHKDCMLCLDNILHTTRLTDREFLTSVLYGYTARSKSGDIDNEERWWSLIEDYGRGDLIRPFSSASSRVHTIDEKCLADILDSVCHSEDKLSLFMGTRRIKLQPCARVKSARK